jgi:hypothetical protein
MQNHKFRVWLRPASAPDFPIQSFLLRRITPREMRKSLKKSGRRHLIPKHQMSPAFVLFHFLK